MEPMKVGFVPVAAKRRAVIRSPENATSRYSSPTRSFSFYGQPGALTIVAVALRVSPPPQLQ